MTKYWLAVVQHDHVERGVELGIVQSNHGSKTGVQRMQPGDGLVYYSPKTSLVDGAPLRRFTAIGTVADGDAWQEESGDFHPWRRHVDYAPSEPTDIAPLLDRLELTRGNRNWGFIMRRGHLEISESDYNLIATEMGIRS